jgi:hypothetical protein
MNKKTYTNVGLVEIKQGTTKTGQKYDSFRLRITNPEALKSLEKNAEIVLVDYKEDADRLLKNGIIDVAEHAEKLQRVTAGRTDQFGNVTTVTRVAKLVSNNIGE